MSLNYIEQDDGRWYTPRQNDVVVGDDAFRRPCDGTCRILVSMATCSGLHGLANCGATSTGTVVRVNGGAFHSGGDSCLPKTPLLLLLLATDRHILLGNSAMVPLPSSRLWLGVTKHELVVHKRSMLRSFSSSLHNAALPLRLNCRRPTPTPPPPHDELLTRSFTSSTILIKISRFLGRDGFLSKVFRRFLEFWTWVL